MTRLLLAAGILAITPALLVVAGLVSIVDNRRKAKREQEIDEALYRGGTTEAPSFGDVERVYLTDEQDEAFERLLNRGPRVEA